MLVQQILNAKPDNSVHTIAPDRAVAEAAVMLTNHKIGAVVVSSNGQTALGILSERDIVRGIAMQGAGCLAASVETLMTAQIVTCTRHETSDAILSKMTQGRFRHIPVLEGDQMVGLISIGDVVKAQLSTLAMEKEALEGMIRGF